MSDNPYQPGWDDGRAARVRATRRFLTTMSEVEPVEKDPRDVLREAELTLRDKALPFDSVHLPTYVLAVADAMEVVRSAFAAGRAALPDPHDWTAAITTLRHAMCCPAGREQVEKDLLRPFGYPTESVFTEAAALPDERLREADRKVILEWAKFTRDESAGYWGKREEDVYDRLLAAADREKPDEPKEKP